GKRGEIQHRTPTVRSSVPDMSMSDVTMAKSGNMEVMHARNVKMKCPAQDRDHAERKAHEKTDQIEIGQSHAHPPLASRPFAANWRLGLASSSRDLDNTWSSRSASPGVSRIAASRMKHRRESSWRAT